MSRPASILVDRRARTHQGLSVGVAVCPNTQVHLGVLHCPDQNAIPTDCTPLTLEQRCCTWWTSTAHADGVCVHSRAQGAPCSGKDPACTRWPRLGSGRRVPSARRPICCLPSPLPLTSRRERTYGLRYSGNTDVENCAIHGGPRRDKTIVSPENDSMPPISRSSESNPHFLLYSLIIYHIIIKELCHTAPCHCSACLQGGCARLCELGKGDSLNPPLFVNH